MILTWKDWFTCTEDEVVHGKTRAAALGREAGYRTQRAICFSPGQVQLPDPAPLYMEHCSKSNSEMFNFIYFIAC